MDSMTIRSFAKVNLSLDVFERRPDGYHDIASVMQSISLSDTMKITITEESFSICVHNAELPADSRNLVFKAYQAVCDLTGEKPNLRVDLEKNIPIAAGLAGGSTDAAGMVIGMNRLLDLKLAEDEIFQIAVELGSDVPFCLIGGAALAQGRGELLTRIESTTVGRILLYKPPISVSTADVYQTYEQLKVQERPDHHGLVNALEEGCLAKAFPFMKNVLESVTMNDYQELQEARQQFLGAGAVHVQMTGSGPTMMVFMEDEKQEKMMIRKVSMLPGEFYAANFTSQGQEILTE